METRQSSKEKGLKRPDVNNKSLNSLANVGTSSDSTLPSESNLNHLPEMNNENIKEASTSSRDQSSITSLKENHMYLIKSDYNPTDEDELKVRKGEHVQFVCMKEKAWSEVINKTGVKGLIPAPHIGEEVVRDHSENTFNLYFFVRILIVFLGFILAICYNEWTVIQSYLFPHKSGSTKNVPKPLDVLSEIEHLKKLYPDVPMNRLANCLEIMLTSTAPCVVLILNDSHEDYTKLLDNIGDVSVRLLKSDEKNNGASAVKVEGSDFIESEQSYFKQHKQQLTEKKVMLVNEIEKIPGRIMEEFHSLCDFYNSAVSQAVIIFLLNLKHMQVDEGKNDATFANNALLELWKNSIHPDIIMPLAVRVSENVIKIKKK